jgi:hypothetical protein
MVTDGSPRRLLSRGLPGRAAIAVGVAASAAVSAGTARAEALRIAYEAPAECPGNEAFAAAVRAQTKSAVLTTEGEGERTISVRIVRLEKELLGRLAIEEPGREASGVSVREVTAATCDEVVSALALMTALAIDAHPKDRPSGPPAPGHTAGSPAGGDAPRRSPSAPPTLKKQAQKRARPSASTPDTGAPEIAARHTTRPRWELGAHAGAFGAVAPNLAWGAVSFLDRSVWDTTGAAWSIRLGLALAESPSVGLAEGTAVFRWTVARIAACPLAVSAGPLTGRPCVGLDAGALRGRGSGLPRPLEETRGWLAATVHGRLQIHLGEGVYLEAEGGFTLPFVRDRFVFVKPARAIHAVPPLSGFTTVGLGVAVP